MKHIQKDCLWSCHKQIQIFYKSVNDSFFFSNLNFFSFKNFTRNKQTKNLLVFVDVTNTSNNCYFIAFYFRFGNHKHSNKDQKGTIFSFFCNLMVSKVTKFKANVWDLYLALPPQNVPNLVLIFMYEPS